MLKKQKNNVVKVKNAFPFDVSKFITENFDLVKKYLSKNTMDVLVPDFELSGRQMYKNNPNIRSRSANFEYSTIQMLEYVKCMKDIIYFCKKYVKIISVDDGVIEFNPYQFQCELLDKFKKNRFVISMQCRQSGKTQTTATYILHYSLFNAAKTTAILANKASQAREILGRVQMSYENLPAFLKQGVLSYNKGSMEFSNNTVIFCAASSSSSIRGKSISLLYIDEAAFLRNDMEFFESTYPTISSGKNTKVIITSTPNGARGLFHKLWMESVNKVNMFVNHAVPWNLVPGRDEAWRLEQIANTSIEQFNQEHGLNFRGSQNSLLSAHVLDALVQMRPVEAYNDLKIYALPEEGRKYLTVCDTSRGLGNDYSAAVTFDITDIPYKVVSTYRNNRLSPMLFPQVIRSIADRYNSAFILVEINDIGEQVASILYHDFEYENLLMCFTEKNKQTIGYIKDARLGVRTTTAVKSIGCSNVKTMIESDKLILNDKDIIEEFGTFIPKGRSYEADSGAHDDLAMCCVLFSWAMNQQYMKDVTDKDVNMNVLEDMRLREQMEDVMAFGIIDDGIDVFNPHALEDIKGMGLKSGGIL